MSDRRQVETTTVEEIAQAKINAIQVREGDPSREAVLRAVSKNLQEYFGDKVEEAASVDDVDIPSATEAPQAPVVPASKESLEGLSDVETVCLEAMREDFDRGIVLIDESSDAGTYGAALEADCSAGTTWKVAQERLLANDSALLKKATTMQGKGELIGVFQSGELCIVDRADKNGNREPVITAFDAENNRITITTDTPDRTNAMQNIAESGKFADYWEILQAVNEDGFTVPQDSPEYEKQGIVAAVEAVSGNPFVRSQKGKEWRSAILDCGNVSRIAGVRVVGFYPNVGSACVDYGYPSFRNAYRGAVRVLRG